MLHIITTILLLSSFSLCAMDGEHASQFALGNPTPKAHTYALTTCPRTVLNQENIPCTPFAVQLTERAHPCIIFKDEQGEKIGSYPYDQKTETFRTPEGSFSLSELSQMTTLDAAEAHEEGSDLITNSEEQNTSWCSIQ